MRLWKRFTAWLCARGLHRRRVLQVMRGGEGPDDSAAYIECAWCGKTGWLWCDGSKSWD